MAKFRKPPFDTAEVAALLQPLMRRAPRNTQIELAYGAAVPVLELAEAIEMWRLDGDKIPGARSIEQAAVRLGRWYHQIRAQGKPVAHATSVETGPFGGAPQVASVVHEDALARQVDAAIDIIDRDKRLDDAVEVRMVAVPSYHLTALWLVGPGIAGVAVLPGVTSDRAETRISIEHLSIIGEENFLSRLKAAGPLGGFSIDPEPDGSPQLSR